MMTLNEFIDYLENVQFENYLRMKIKEVAVSQEQYDVLVLELRDLCSYPDFPNPVYGVKVTTSQGPVKIVKEEM